MQTVNIASAVDDMAQSRPDEVAIFEPTGSSVEQKATYRRWTYRELEAASNEIAAGLLELGLQKGDRTALMVTPSLELFGLTFGLFKAGIVPVMIDPGIGIKKMGACLESAAPQGFIGVAKAHIARLLFGWQRGKLNKVVTVGSRLFWGGKTLKQVRELGRKSEHLGKLAETQGEDIAAILFTSGSTGPPKGVVYRHRHFAAQVEWIQSRFQIEPGEVDLPTFPLFALFDPALGMTTVLPKMNPTKPAKVNPQNILGAINAFNVTTMFGSPALLNRVGRYGQAQGIKVPSLRRVISAGAPVPAPTMAQWHQMMPESGEILPPYGATESLPVACISSREILGETWAKTEQGLGVCVGSPFAELDVAIIPISDQPIENFEESSRLDTEEIGEICVRGAVVTDQYWNADRHNKLGKMKSPEGVWHRMGDLGYFDEQGRLWFCGRKAHRVQIGSKCLFSIPTEAPFNTHPKVFRTALVGPTNRENKRVAALCVEFEQGLSPQEQTQTLEELKEIRDSLDNLKMISVLLPHPSFPVDIRHNAKINREALKEWAEKELR